MGKYRVQINAQATVYQKTGKMITETVTLSGLIVPKQVEEEQEFECEQLCVSFKGTSINETELDEKLKQLAQGIKNTMMKKGLVV